MKKKETTLYNKIEIICDRYDISIDKINEKFNKNDYLEIYLCMYPTLDVFYKVYDELQNLLNEVARECIYFETENLFDLIYGENSVSNSYDRLSEYIKSTMPNDSKISAIAKGRSFNTLINKDTLLSIAHSSRKAEYILYGKKNDVPTLDSSFRKYTQLNANNKLIIDRDIDKLLREQISEQTEIKTAAYAIDNNYVAKEDEDKIKTT